MWPFRLSLCNGAVLLPCFSACFCCPACLCRLFWSLECDFAVLAQTASPWDIGQTGCLDSKNYYIVGLNSASDRGASNFTVNNQICLSAVKTRRFIGLFHLRQESTPSQSRGDLQRECKECLLFFWAIRGNFPLGNFRVKRPVALQNPVTLGKSDSSPGENFTV